MIFLRFFRNRNFFKCADIIKSLIFWLIILFVVCVAGIVGGLIVYFVFQKVIFPKTSFYTYLVPAMISSIKISSIFIIIFLRNRISMNRVYHGHHGLTQVLVISIRLLKTVFDTEHAAVAMKISPIIFLLAMTIRMLWNVHQENVKIYNVIVI